MGGEPGTEGNSLEAGAPEAPQTLGYARGPGPIGVSLQLEWVKSLVLLINLPLHLSGNLGLQEPEVIGDT